VRASGLNFKDVLNALDMYPGDAGPLGSECAGTVVAVGAGVEDLAVGTEVVAIAAGCLGTHVTTGAALVVAKPPALAPEQAASLPVAYVTAAYALSTVGAMRPGDRVLIHAGAGGVGLAAVRVAQHCGAEVLATAGSPEKRAFLRAQGVTHVFDSRSLEFRDGVMAATGGRGVDVVLNSLSGEAIDASLAVVAAGGRFLEIGKRGILDAAEVARRRPDVRYVVIDWSDVARATPAVIRCHLTEVLEAVEAGRLAVPPVSLFPLTDAVAAFRHMAQARHIGKIVLVAPREVPATRPSVRADATYLVTGGFGGLGLEVARWLVERGARSLVLTGRRAPSEAAGTAIAALREAGTEVSLIEADVARADAVDRVMAEIARAGRPLRGIVHAAGTLDNAVLSEQDAGRLARVMAAKVDGTWNLERATRHLTLDFFVLFSSAAALLGSPGQANHAAANVFLDAVAHHRRARGLAALSLDWGAWSEVGAAAREETARRIALQGMGRMRPDEALVALAIAMNGDEAQVAVLPVDWASLRARRSAKRRPSLLRALEGGEPGPRRSGASAGTAEALLARLREAAPAKRQRLLSEHIASRVTRVLGLDASQVIDPLRPLKELGIDSLMAVELRNVLKADLALEGGLPATLVFDYPTVEAIAVYLGQTVLGLPASGPEPGGSPESADPASRADGVLSRVELLSDDEVDRMLGERLRSAGP
jgi:NADPH:quinone reductase-like Zn-dependent oxidoreductase/NAD(P)-dependent dehydrogenase (short-subunit alcohol dehydrogenase family)/acyl carrier protein